MNDNTLLRRADWRFLVGAPHPRAVFCPPGGGLRQAIATVGARLVDEPAEGECDLAVLRNPGTQRLRRAFSALEPGGSLYVEWWLPVIGGAARAERRIEAAGFEQAACYWPWPPPVRRSPQFWLPIDSRQSIAWFLRTRPRPDSALAQIAAVQRLVWRLLWRLGLLVPTCLTARKPGPSAAGEESAADLGACLLITAGRSTRNKLVVLGFDDNQAEPQVALKLARVAEAEAGLDREASALEAAHAQRERSGIPRLLGRTTFAGQPALAESVVTGRPLVGELVPQTLPSLSLKVTDFLIDLAASPPPSRSTAWREGVAKAAQQALTHSERQGARAVLDTLGALPEACEQRDCSPWNLLLRSDGSIAMLDWESAEPKGVAGLDLVYFLSYASFFVDGTMHSGEELSSYRRMLTPYTHTGQVYADCTVTYAERLGLDAGAWEALRLLCWLVHARSAQLHEEPETIGPAADGSLFLELAREELARQAARDPKHGARED
jgi:hypothetical protein